MSVMSSQLQSSLAVFVIAAVMAASWSCSSGAELINDLVDSSRHQQLPYDSYQGDPRESNWDDSALSEEKRARSQAWRAPPSDWSVNKRYMRFGRSGSDDVDDVDAAAYPNDDDKRYMRFGKRYMRFGRRVGNSRARDLFQNP